MMNNSRVLLLICCILAIALNSVAFPNDRLVVKIAMFAIGVAVGGAFSTIVIDNKNQ